MTAAAHSSESAAWRSLPGRSLVSAAIVVALTGVAVTLVARSEGGHALPAASPGPAWTPLPGIPAPQNGSTGVSIGAVGKSLYIAVGVGSGRTQRLGLYRLSGRRWVGPLGGRRTVLRGELPNLVSWRDMPCLQTNEAGVGAVWCLAGAAWKRVGSPIFAKRPGLTLERLSVVNGTLLAGYLERSERVASDGRRVSSPPTAHLLRLNPDTASWNELDTAPLTLPGRQLRYVLPFGRGDELCLSINDMPAAEVASPNADATGIRTRCLGSAGWASVAPDITGTRPRVQSDAVVQVGADTIVGVFRSVLLAGRYKFGFSFRVLRLRDGAWEDTPLGDENPNWLEQGRVYNFGEEAWALVFSQRPGSGGGPQNLDGKLVVRRLVGGNAANVGAPLLRNHKIYGPIHWDMASAGGKIYVMYPQPDPRTRVNRIRIAVLTGA